METFYKAFLTPQVSICGFSLNDFSYNHLAILRAIDSPFVSSDNTRHASSSDLITALKVCSSQYPDREYTFKRRDYIQAYILKLKPRRLQVECYNLSYYIESHQQLPQFWEFDSSGGWGSSSSPDELSTISLLIKNNIDHDKAWNMSIGYVNWLSATFLEQSGNPRVFADHDEDNSIINLNDQSEKDIERIAIEQLGEERALKWLKARKKAGA